MGLVQGVSNPAMSNPFFVTAAKVIADNKCLSDTDI